VSTFPSPDAHYVLVNVDTTDSDPPHVLFLEDARAKSRVVLYEYPRWATFFWAPDSNALVVNDFSGSDFADVVLFQLGDHLKQVSLRETLFAQKGDVEQRAIENHHVFLEFLAWLDSRHVSLKLHGYGDRDPGGFEVCFIYDLDGSFLDKACPKDS
jgi:hypothetical protein